MKKANNNNEKAMNNAKNVQDSGKMSEKSTKGVKNGSKAKNCK